VEKGRQGQFTASPDFLRFSSLFSKFISIYGAAPFTLLFFFSPGAQNLFILLDARAIGEIVYL